MSTMHVEPSYQTRSYYEQAGGRELLSVATYEIFIDR